MREIFNWAPIFITSKTSKKLFLIYHRSISEIDTKLSDYKF